MKAATCIGDPSNGCHSRTRLLAKLRTRCVAAHRCQSARINHLEAEISDENCNMGSGIGRDPSQQSKNSRSKAARYRVPSLLCIQQITRSLLLSIMAARGSISFPRMALVPKFSKDQLSSRKTSRVPCDPAPPAPSTFHVLHYPQYGVRRRYGTRTERTRHVSNKTLAVHHNVDCVHFHK
jgi:hypothetical protein